MWVDPTDEGSGDSKGEITRGYFYNMQLVCSFNKYANVNASFRPQDREENLIQVPGLGSFQFFFDFYIDEQFGVCLNQKMTGHICYNMLLMNGSFTGYVFSL